MIERQSRQKMKPRKNRKKIAILTLVVLLVLGAGGYLFRKPLAVMAFDLFLSGKV
ncbi:LytR family transcriptional regulator, partial [Salmonella enterica subsp. enterica]|nr:LytR family transcriptional regulator [Salmonella enterica subsp. enterica]